MSGGSYQYLCYKDASDLGSFISEAYRMRDRLRELGYETEAVETQEVIDHYNEIDKKIQEMSSVWEAVEWMDSGDRGEDQTAETIRIHRLRHKL